MIKTRFCPSPTGVMHLGNARTALFNTLLTAKEDDCFLLRIEDTDASRSFEHFTDKMKEDLRWLGLQWQEGPEADQGNGPYLQSKRKAIYNKYYTVLEEQGDAYPCFCSDTQLAINRKLQLASGQPPRYPGTCRNLTQKQIQQKLDEGLKPTLRLRVPDEVEVRFTDLVRGEQCFKSDDIGDFIIRRDDGSASFMFCNAVDDALMEVTHAMRGEDHLTNTPRQLLILKMLNLPAPQYGHFSLIVAQDGKPLSKRNGSRSIRDLAKEGYLPLAVTNYLARLGHTYASPEFMSFTELAEAFSTENLGRAPAKFTPDQLIYWQKQAIAHEDDENLWQWMGETVHQLVPADLKQHFINVIRPNSIFPQDAYNWAKVFFSPEIEYSEETWTILQQAGKEFFIIAKQAIEQGADNKTLTNLIKEKLNVKGKALFQPLRLALTDQLQGPDMADLFQLMGKELIKTRFATLAQRL